MWLIAALVPGFKRQPLKKIDADAPSLLKLPQELARQSRLGRASNEADRRHL
ncbi:hypothetical protein [Mesorhizobium vachelliae]|nr:hypothetical protein [Mesorhizobium sp. VK25D]